MEDKKGIVQEAIQGCAGIVQGDERALLERKEILQEAIGEAELILVGIGEEFGEKLPEMECDPKLSGSLAKIKETEGLRWILPYLKKGYRDSCRTEKTAKAYDVLAKILGDKNYFIVSTRMDDYIYETKLKEEKIVTPCGGYRYCHCEGGCGKGLYKADQQLPGKIYEYLSGGGRSEELQPPLCPDCGKKLVFNCVEEEGYIEEGYLEQWNKYMRWLQGTLNKKLCVLELGAGMQYPTVIRWPFEKVVFFNQKSNMFRIHSKLYHLTEEMKERGYSVKEKPMDFLINWFV